MQSHTRAMTAAIAYAIVTGHSVAGVYDHSAQRHLRIAAECREDRVQALDGDRGAKVGGTLPNLYDEGSKTYISAERTDAGVRGFDHGAAGHYEVTISGRTVQLYDHAQAAWFAYDVQTLEGSLG